MVSGVSRRTVLAAMTIPFVGSLAGCLGRDWDSFPPTTFTVGTGNPGGVFARYGEALSEVIGRRLTGITSKTRLTDASVENLRMVSDGTLDLGFSLGDTASDAARGTGSFDQALDVVALARTYDSFVHLVVRDDSPIRTAADLRGRRVGVGAAGSGTRVIATRILGQSGIALSDIDVSSVPLEGSSAGILDGSLAAFFFVSGLPNQTVLSLSRQMGIRLISLRGVVDSMAREYGPEYVVGPIPASAYGLPNAVDTVSVKNYIVAEGKMPSQLAYAVTRVMFEYQDEIDRLAPGVAQPGIGAAIFTSPLDLHPGALRYYRERRG
ncbi:MAG: TAXI family TRAP transporter solute-binding subunit [Actinomycetota bacterium]|nr:TAXI family TRAP transporter solute-binding subunit [Actinomycetota bacterium]